MIAGNGCFRRILRGWSRNRHMLLVSRWIVAIVVTTLVVSTIRTYWNIHLPNISETTNSAPLPQSWRIEGDGDGDGGDNGQQSKAQTSEQVSESEIPAQVNDTTDEIHLPAWISTPPPFDISKLPGFITTTTTTTTEDRPDESSSLPSLVEEAMVEFLRRPVLSHEQAVVQNEVECPREQLQNQCNADQLRNDREKWLAVNETGIMQMRHSLFDFIKAVSAQEGGGALIGPGLGPDDQDIEEGSRGLVLTAGNHRTVDAAVACIKATQKLGWKGAIEVWHFDNELESEEDRQLLRDLGVKIHQVSTEKMPGQWKNFELKAEAIRRSSFDEVLYLDSDNFPLSDITPLFDAPLFTDPRGGQAIFWPDLNRDHPDNAIHRVLGIPCHDAWELDSGQILIRKSGNGGLNLAALYIAQYMQTEGDFWFSGGDKDTFRYAFLVLGLSYTPAPRWLAVLGHSVNERTFCGSAMLQYGISQPQPEHVDPSDPTHPAPLFAHANLVKHMYNARKGQTFTQMRRLALTQDSVRNTSTMNGQHEKRPLDSVVGGAKNVRGRGLCSDIWAFREGGADVETVDTKEAFGGLMRDFDEHYFGYGAKAGTWR